MTTEEQVVAIASEWKEKYAPKGLEVDLTPNGELNGQIISTFMQNNKLPFTVESLNKAVEAEKHRFIWQPGFGPKVAPSTATRPKGDRFNQLADAGVRQFRAPGDTHAERQADAANRAKEAEVQRQAAITRQKAAEQDRLQKAEESQIIFHESGPWKGQVNNPATFAAQKAAREKWAKIRGVTTKPEDYRIPLMATAADLKKGTPAQIRAWSEERRRNNMPTSINV